MRPQTVHAAAQLVRHTRGLLTTIEKWASQTPPEVLHAELADLLWIVRGGLQHMHVTLGTSQPDAAPVPGDHQQR